MRIELENFRCHSSCAFEIHDGKITLLSGPSGVGKSSVLMGISYALYGNERRVLAYGAKKCVARIITDEEMIERINSPARLTVTIEERELRDDEAQEYIYQTYGKEFQTVSYISQEPSSSFATMTPGERMTFLEKTVLERWNLSEKKKRIALLLAECKHALTLATGRLEGARRVLGSEPEKPERVGEKKLKNARVRYNNARILHKRGRKKKDELVEELSSLAKRDALEEKASSLKKELASIERIDVDEAEREYLLVRELQRKTSKKKNTLLRELEEAIAQRGLEERANSLRNELSSIDRIDVEEAKREYFTVLELYRKNEERKRELLRELEETIARGGLEKALRSRLATIQEIETVDTSVSDAEKALVIAEKRSEESARFDELERELESIDAPEIPPDEKEEERAIVSERAKRELEKLKKPKRTSEELEKLLEKCRSRLSVTRPIEAMDCPKCETRLALEGTVLVAVDEDWTCDRTEYERLIAKEKKSEKLLAQTREYERLKCEIDPNARSSSEIAHERRAYSQRARILARLEKRPERFDSKVLKEARETLLRARESEKVRKETREIEKKLAAFTDELRSPETIQSEIKECTHIDISRERERYETAKRNEKKAVEIERRLSEIDLGKPTRDVELIRTEIAECTEIDVSIERERYETAKRNVVRAKEIETRLSQIVLEKVDRSPSEIRNEIAGIKLDELANDEEKYEREKEEVERNYALREKWDEWKTRKDEEFKALAEEMNASADLDACETLKRLFETAESTSLTNFLNEVNSHAQIFADEFFLDHPLEIRLASLYNKSGKPRIELKIFYRGNLTDVNALSGGEKARVILALTLALSELFGSKLILIDECTASLDANATETVVRALRTHFAKRTVVIVAHQCVQGIFDEVISF